MIPLRYVAPSVSDIKTPKYDVIGIFLAPSPCISRAINRDGVHIKWMVHQPFIKGHLLIPLDNKPTVGMSTWAWGYTVEEICHFPLQ